MGIAYNPRIITNGLVLCLDAANAKSYPGSGTAWTDLSGRGNTGTLTGAGYSSSNGGSISFDGTDDYINCGSPSILNSFSSGVTCCAWIKSSSTNIYSGIIQKWYQSGFQGGYQMNISTGNVVSFAIGDNLSNYSGISGTTNVINGIWHYCVGTYDLSTIKVYVDTSLNGSFASSRSVVNSNNSTLYVGQDDFSPSRRFNGNIAQTQIYNRALTAAEIQQNYNALKSRYI